MKNTSQIVQYLKNIKLRDLIYPGVLALFFGTVITVFFFAIRFISQNINRAFSPEESGAAQALDLARYKFIAEKLNIPVDISQDGAPVAIEETAIEEPQGVAVKATTTSAVIAPDKSAVTIAVKNSTAKKGVAAALAKTFEDAGFQKPQTGNESGLYATTTVLLKESKRDYETLLLEEVRKAYPDAIATTSLESASYDAIIIIGSQ